MNALRGVTRRRETAAPILQTIQGTPHAFAVLVQHMRLDQGRPHIFMAEQLLHRADIAAVPTNARRARATRYEDSEFGHPASVTDLLHRPLHRLSGM